MADEVKSSKPSLINEVSGSKYSAVLSQASRQANSAGRRDSRQTWTSSQKLTSLPDIIFYPEQDEDLQTVNSTEEICNDENECFTFKTITDPGLYRAYYNRAGKKLEQGETEEEIYLRLAKQAKVAPVKRIVDSLGGTKFELQYYGLDCKQMKALSEAMVHNTTVRELNLKGNALDLDAAYHMGQMLRKNGTLKVLNLQFCKINSESAEMLGKGLEICASLTNLDLSHNEFGDEGMEALALKLGYNTSVHKLNLSHNNLTHKSGFFLAECMEENRTLQELDLSWNQMHEEKGLKKFLSTTADHNESLRRLNLSWNSLEGDKTANIIKNFISKHQALQELNLSHNKFQTVPECSKIGKGVTNSKSLRVLNMSFNGMTSDSAFSLLNSISGKSELRTLYLSNVWVKPEFDKLRAEAEAQTGLKVVVEGVSGGAHIAGPDMQALLLKRAHFLGYKPKKNKKDFGWFLLRLQKAGNLAPVKKPKFEKLVQEDKIKFDEGMIDEFSKKFKDQKKMIDLTLMLERYLNLFPDTALPKPKEKKTRKGSKDRSKSKERKDEEVKSEIGPSKDADILIFDGSEPILCEECAREILCDDCFKRMLCDDCIDELNLLN